MFYHESANRLAASFQGKPIDDVILMPFLLLYRQAYELLLKTLIIEFVSLRINCVDGSTEELERVRTEEYLQRKMGHNLQRLLVEVRRHYALLVPAEPFDGSVVDIIGMLHEADPYGTAFRYAGGLPEDQEYIDFPDLARLLNERYQVLGSIGDYVDDLYSHVPRF